MEEAASATSIDFFFSLEKSKYLIPSPPKTSKSVRYFNHHVHVHRQQEMSWKRSGQLISGPPSSSSDFAGPSKLSDRIRPNGGVNTFQRERELASRYGGPSYAEAPRKTEWDVLKENHRYVYISFCLCHGAGHVSPK